MLSANSEDVEMLDGEDEDEDEEEAVLGELEEDGKHIHQSSSFSTDCKAEHSEEEEEPEPDEDEEDLPPALGKGDRNSQLTVGYKGDRSYVVRGNNIGVFSHDGDQVKYYATISKVSNPNGKEFNPQNVKSILRVSSPLLTEYLRLCCTNKTTR